MTYINKVLKPSACLDMVLQASACLDTIPRPSSMTCLDMVPWPSSIRHFGGLDQTRIQQLRQLLPQLSQLWWSHPIGSLSRRSRPWHELYLMIRLPSRWQLLKQLGRHNISKSPQYGGNSVWHFDLLVRLDLDHYRDICVLTFPKAFLKL